MKSAWQSQQQQQQQQDTSESASCSTRQLVQSQELPSTRKLERTAESPVEKEPEFKVDLQNRRNCTRCNRERWRASGKHPRSRGKFRNGSRSKSILEDLGKPENSMKFSEESSRTIHELGNIELYELGQISRTVQCHACLKHVPEGLIFCSYGICLRPHEETIKRIKSRYQALIVLCYFARSESLKGQEARRDSVATRPLESNEMPKEEQEGTDHGNVARALS